MDKEVYDKLLKDFLAGDIEDLKKKYRMIFLSNEKKIYLDEGVWINKIKISEMLRAKMLETGLEQEEFLQMNSELLYEKIPGLEDIKTGEGADDAVGRDEGKEHKKKGPFFIKIGNKVLEFGPER